MTNRCRSSGGGSAKNGGPLRYLDLSFEGRQQANTAVLNNGFRPHGGYRGTKKYPPSPYSFNKPADYHQQLQQDLDQLFENEDRTASPTWAVDVLKEPNHSGESPLFVRRLLTPGRAPVPQSASSSRRTPPSSRDSPSYYRPNRTHQYLTATELKDCSQAEVDVKLGRPTRTTLLRARQRCNSAPVNAYEHRRTLQKKAEEREEQRRSMGCLTMKDLLGLTLPEGESLHSFLIGARYNRAHYLDARSLNEYGVYMPRGNPLGCFVVKNKASPEQPEDETPPAPPDSPVNAFELESVYSDEGESLSPCPPHPSPPGSPINPQPTVQARPNTAEPKTGEEAEEKHTKDEEEHIEQIFNLDDGLNVKGVGLNKGRSKSARPVSSPKMPPVFTDSSRPRTPRGGLPSVQIQGTSITRSPRHSEAGERNAAAPTPLPVPMPGTPLSSPQPPRSTTPQPPPQTPTTPVPVAVTPTTPVPVAVTPTTPVPVAMTAETPVPTIILEKPSTPEEQNPVAPKVVKMDKSVNVPSIDGDASPRQDVILTPRVMRLQHATANQKVAAAAAASPAANQDAATSPAANQKEANQNGEMTSPATNQDVATSPAANQSGEMTSPAANQDVSASPAANQEQAEEPAATEVQTEEVNDADKHLDAQFATLRKSKVRFADEMDKNNSQDADPVQTSDSAVFFITEDMGEDPLATKDQTADPINPLLTADQEEVAVKVDPLPTMDQSTENTTRKISVDSVAENSSNSIEDNPEVISVDFAPKTSASDVNAVQDDGTK